MATGVAEEEDKHGGFDDETMRMLSANLPDKIFRSPDPRLQIAAMEAERTNQMTPMLKEELRLRILAKRLARGDPDIETTHTTKTYELTDEEKLKRERRKEQNRRAAKKCREKRKLRNLDVAETFDNLREENKKLNQEIYSCQKQKDKLEEYIHDHIRSGQCKVSSSLNMKLPAPGCDSTGLLTPQLICTPDEQSCLNLPLSPPTPISPTPPILCLPPNSIPATTTTQTCPSPEVFITDTTTNNNFTTTNQAMQASFNHQNHLTVQILPTSGVHALLHHPQGHSVLNQSQPQAQITATYRDLSSCTSSSSYQSCTIPTTPQPVHPRPVISYTPSTLPPPQSPCTGHQSSSITLTPPPSVSSELYIVPESPSVLTSCSTYVQGDLMVQCMSTTDQHLSHSIVFPQCSGLHYQLSPADSLSGKSPTELDISVENMFDDEDDEDDVSGNDFSHLLDTLG